MKFDINTSNITFEVNNFTKKELDLLPGEPKVVKALRSKLIISLEVSLFDEEPIEESFISVECEYQDLKEVKKFVLDTLKKLMK